MVLWCVNAVVKNAVCFMVDDMDLTWIVLKPGVFMTNVNSVIYPGSQPWLAKSP